MKKKRRSKIPLLVINGCPRSGTSFLDGLLAKKFNAAVMPETHFIPYINPYLFLWGHLKTVKSRKKFIQAIYDFTEIRTNGTGLNVDQMRPYCLLATEPHSSNVVDNALSYPEILEKLFDIYCRLHSGSVATEKTAYYHPVAWEKILKALPNALFINVVRDGRDVVTSWKKTWFGPKNLVHAAWLWREHIRAGMKFENDYPEHCLNVRYEDLVLSPQDSIQRISEFVNVPISSVDYDQSSTEWYTFINKNQHMVNLTKPTKRNNTEKWRTAMSINELAVFEAVAGYELENCGYPLSVLPSVRISSGKARKLVLKARFSSFFSKLEWKRRMVRILPPALWFARLFGISLPILMRKMMMVRGNQ